MSLESTTTPCSTYLKYTGFTKPNTYVREEMNKKTKQEKKYILHIHPPEQIRTDITSFFSYQKKMAKERNKEKNGKRTSGLVLGEFRI
ncbi:hypothetical protein CEXT_478981 [Caerostris extrusa]|uniref:Uncharacterized protein n=1 Tax=Caerostris extrusa TaxID=172846 RepID=A0AAV4Y6F8_CAEEX|nr:hypothetical protein CEXT_478981 [Caerostris extrusa]